MITRFTTRTSGRLLSALGSGKFETTPELMRSVSKNGVLMPVLVRKIGEKLEVLDGKRRIVAVAFVNYQAPILGRAQILEIPVELIEGTDEEVSLRLWGRSDLRPELQPR